MKKVLFLILVLCFAGELLAQGSDYLVVYKPGKKKHYYYYIGSQIILKPTHKFPKVKGIITGFSDSAIYFGPVDSFHFSQIESIVVNNNPRIFGKNMWVSNLVVSTGTIALWQVMYLVNTGEPSPDVKSAPAIIGFVTLAPILVNQLAILFTREECRIANGSWKLGTVIIPRK